MWHHGLVGGWGLGLGGPFIQLVLIALVIIAVAWVIRASAGSGEARNAAPTSRALEVLEERYARGEIGRDEFLQKKRDMQAYG